MAILDDADHLNVEGANSLLKTLEEPPPRSVLILLSTSLQRQLPTIRSRSQIVRFAPLSHDTLAQLMVEQGLTDDLQQAQVAAEASDGGLASAVELLRPDLHEFRPRLYELLGSKPLHVIELERAIDAFLDADEGAKNKGGAQKRDRSRLALRLAIDFYRQWTRTLVGGEARGDATLQQYVEQADSRWRLTPDQTLACTDRCLLALGHLDRNAYGKFWLLSWCHDLSALHQGLPADAADPLTV